MRRVYNFLSVFIFFLFLCSPTWANDPFNPPDFSHETKKSRVDSRDSYSPDFKINLSIARVNDNTILAESPFGKEAESYTITHLPSGATVETKKKYDTSKDEYGYSKEIRDILIYQLSSIKCLQLLERENINKIIREWEFGETKYVARQKAQPAIELPELIAKGILSFNKNLEKEGTEDAWDDVENANDEYSNHFQHSEKKKEDKDKQAGLQFTLRLYNTQTSHIKYIAYGKGKTQGEAVSNAVADLKTHIDLLLPEINVVSVDDDTVTLSSGRLNGLTEATHFYLVRTNTKRKIDVDYNSIDYIALCKVIDSGDSEARAEILKTYGSETPEIGDLVFYQFSKYKW